VTVGLAACGASGRPRTRSATPALSLVAQGKQLYASQGCEDCHSLNGTLATGPSWKGLYESAVHLASGRTVIADGAYLTKHIVDPNALTVNGFPGDVMEEAIAADDLPHKPSYVRALVAFIESLR
jgi:mono/diheme cytochrome c family protein